MTGKTTGTGAPRLSVVIPARDAAGTLGGQLAALRSQRDAPRFEVIVADNGSRDGTADRARQLAGTLDLRVVPAGRAPGANVARNEGCRHARAELILFLDADDVVAPGALRAVLASFDDDADLDLATGVPDTEDPEGFVLPVAQGYLPYGISAFLAVRRRVLDRIGGFDESFVRGHDEVDFCWRAQQAGFRLGLVRAARFAYRPRRRILPAFHQYRRYGRTYVQLYVKHRHRGLRGSDARSELRALRGLPRTLLRLLRPGDRADRLDAARGLGWAVGRWQGHLRFRVWGPR